MTQIIICRTTKNTRKDFGLMHTIGSTPTITPSAKEAHRSGVGEGEEPTGIPLFTIQIESSVCTWKCCSNLQASQSPKVAELRAANEILRLATNSFTTNCSFQLDTFCGPKQERPVVYLHSCMIRAAAKTMDCFSLQHLTVQGKGYRLPSRRPPPAWQN